MGPQHTFSHTSLHLPPTFSPFPTHLLISPHFNTRLPALKMKSKLNKSRICGYLQRWILLGDGSFMFFRSGNMMVMFNFCAFKYFFVKLGFHDFYGSNRWSFPQSRYIMSLIGVHSPAKGKNYQLDKYPLLV